MRFTTPAGTCDTHMHIYGTPGRTLDDYRTLRARLGISRTVYVQPSDFTTDNSLLTACIAADGDKARGIAVIDPDASDADLDHLHSAGVRGVRFHDIVAGCLTYDVLEKVAARIANWGWHVIVQSEGDRLVELAPRLAALRVPVVVDHMGRIAIDRGLDHPAFVALLRLVDLGHVWVKLCAPYHVTRDYRSLDGRGRALIAAAPERMLWGTNWPHPSVSADRRPDDAELLDVLFDWAGGQAALTRILVDNPAALYGF